MTKTQTQQHRLSRYGGGTTLTQKYTHIHIIVCVYTHMRFSAFKQNKVHAKGMYPILLKAFAEFRRYFFILFYFFSDSRFTLLQKKKKELNTLSFYFPYCLYYNTDLICLYYLLLVGVNTILKQD